MEKTYAVLLWGYGMNEIEKLAAGGAVAQMLLTMYWTNGDWIISSIGAAATFGVILLACSLMESEELENDNNTRNQNEL